MSFREEQKRSLSKNKGINEWSFSSSKKDIFNFLKNGKPPRTKRSCINSSMGVHYKSKKSTEPLNKRKQRKKNSSMSIGVSSRPSSRVSNPLIKITINNYNNFNTKIWKYSRHPMKNISESNSHSSTLVLPTGVRRPRKISKTNVPNVSFNTYGKLNDSCAVSPLSYFYLLN